MDVGKKIKELREKAGMTLEELAQKAGMDPECVRGVEDYLGSLCSFKTAEQVFQALDCELRAVWSGGEWRTMDEKPPKSGEYYECVVLFPGHCGRGERCVKVLHWSSGLGWGCENMIVTHWRELPELPEILGGFDGA